MTVHQWISTMDINVRELDPATLRDYALQYAEPSHPRHQFGKSCAVELMIRDQNDCCMLAELALQQIPMEVKRTYGISNFYD